MKTLERWVLDIADSDTTWFGLHWLRPARHERIGLFFILCSSLLLSVPGVAIAAAVIYLPTGQASSDLWLALFALVMSVQVSLHLLFAYFWNRRTATLIQHG